MRNKMIFVVDVVVAAAAAVLMCCLKRDLVACYKCEISYKQNVSVVAVGKLEKRRRGYAGVDRR